MLDAEQFASIYDIPSFHFALAWSVGSWMTTKGEKVRKRLLAAIEQNPGIRFMELTRICGMSNGELSYHLKILEEGKLVRVDRSSGFTGCYLSSFPNDEVEVLNVIRQSARGRIVAILLQRENCTFRELAGLCKRAPSTVSAQLSLLNKKGIVSVVYGKPALYRISNREVARIIHKHLKSLPNIDDFKIANLLALALAAHGKILLELIAVL